MFKSNTSRIFIVATLGIIMILGIALWNALSSQQVDPSLDPIYIDSRPEYTSIPSPTNQPVRDCSEDTECGGGCNRCQNNRCVNMCNSEKNTEPTPVNNVGVQKHIIFCESNNDCPVPHCPEGCPDPNKVCPVGGCPVAQCIDGQCQTFLPQ